jgi:hypothetical protein
MQPNSKPDTIVLIHGFWVTPRSWEKWITRFESRGYRVIAPAYPGFEVEVEALNQDPNAHREGDRDAESSIISSMWSKAWTSRRS